MLSITHPPLPETLMRRPCLRLDLGRGNRALRDIDVADPAAFAAWLAAELAAHGCTWAAGGHAEDRALYEMSPVFAAADGVRSLHLGTDLWMPAGTPVHCVAAGRIHSFADNARFGDYGPTIIVEHGLADGGAAYSLYGHLSRRSLASLAVGRPVAAGERLGWLGTASENLGWAPHLHLQLISDIGEHRGDFPGVCHSHEAQAWLRRCPSVEHSLKRWMVDLRTHDVDRDAAGNRG